ncbi:nucleotidyltransferase domain-containing protein [Candidatus Woesearchaeota archaeon]|nr:nucleotidyltransferase domain-containing protein [Candidatus Woesearchaeota archaeon]
MVNIYLSELTNLQQGIVRVLSIKSGISLNQRALANLLGVSAPAVIKALPALEKKAIIKVAQDKNSKRWSIELNRDNPYIMQQRRADNLLLIYECGLFNYLEKEFAGASIILFGSYSRGEDTINSDIDIAVIGRKDKKINVDVFEKKLERKININFYDTFKGIHKHLKENLCNGIVLSGGIEL